MTISNASIINNPATNPDEGQNVDFDINFTSDSPVQKTVVIIWGDGTSEVQMVPGDDPGAFSAAYAHVFGVWGIYNITFFLFDSDEASVNVGMVLQVENVPPSINSAYGTLDDNTGATVAYIDYYETGVGVSCTTTVDWGDGSTPSVSLGSTTVVAEHTYTTQVNGSYRRLINISITDVESGGGGLTASTSFYPSITFVVEIDTIAYGDTYVDANMSTAEVVDTIAFGNTTATGASYEFADASGTTETDMTISAAMDFVSIIVPSNPSCVANGKLPFDQVRQ